MLCGVKLLNACVPAVVTALFVASNVAVPALKVDEDEYQHFKSVISAAA